MGREITECQAQREVVSTILGQPDLVETVCELLRQRKNPAYLRCDLRTVLSGSGIHWDDDQLNMLVETGTSIVLGFRMYLRATERYVLEEWPAFELVNFDGLEEDWNTTWRSHGGQLFGGRMVALKTDLIWILLSEFGFPFPPFRRGSGYSVMEVSRSEAMAFGLI